MEAIAPCQIEYLKKSALKKAATKLKLDELKTATSRLNL
jgi:hypothetical protein